MTLPHRLNVWSGKHGLKATKNRAATGNTDAIPRGSGTLRIAYAPGWRLPADYVSAFEAASGYTVEQSEYARILRKMPTSSLASIQTSCSFGHGIPVGNDPVCAWADRSWFSQIARHSPLHSRTFSANCP